jgi:hypothetical protein
VASGRLGLEDVRLEVCLGLLDVVHRTPRRFGFSGPDRREDRGVVRERVAPDVVEVRGLAPRWYEQLAEGSSSAATKALPAALSSDPDRLSPICAASAPCALWERHNDRDRGRFRSNGAKISVSVRVLGGPCCLPSRVFWA